VKEKRTTLGRRAQLRSAANNLRAMKKGDAVLSTIRTRPKKSWGWRASARSHVREDERRRRMVGRRAVGEEDADPSGHARSIKAEKKLASFWSRQEKSTLRRAATPAEVRADLALADTKL